MHKRGQGRLDSIIVHFLKAIRPTLPDFQEINILRYNRRNIAFKRKRIKQ